VAALGGGRDRPGRRGRHYRYHGIVGFHCDAGREPGYSLGGHDRRQRRQRERYRLRRETRPGHDHRPGSQADLAVLKISARGPAEDDPHGLVAVGESRPAGGGDRRAARLVRNGHLRHCQRPGPHGGGAGREPRLRAAGVGCADRCRHQPGKQRRCPALPANRAAAASG